MDAHPSRGIMTTSLKKFAGTLVLVGAGKMGGAMLEGWLGLGLDPRRVAVLEPHPSSDIAGLTHRGLALNPASGSVKDAAAIMIAVKPQVAAEVVPGLAALVGRASLVVSIMAGKTMGFLEQALPAGTAV